MGRTLAGRSRTIAVLSSIAALGGGATALAATGHGHTSNARLHSSDQGTPAAGPGDLTAAECAALAAVQKAITADSASIATPILDADVSAGTITSAQEATLLALIEKGGPAGPGPGGPGGHPGIGGPPPSGATGASGSS
ncbi:MAG: hypothetical protein ABSG64_08320 [Solirubrobacteraceae bacterium]|jgi:hypothetical protein